MAEAHQEVVDLEERREVEQEEEELPGVRQEVEEDSEEEIEVHQEEEVEEAAALVPEGRPEVAFVVRLEVLIKKQE